MRLRGVIAATCALMLVMAACSSDDGGGGGGTGGDGEVTLDFWVFEEGGLGSFLTTLEEDFEAENPNINIEFTQYPEENYDVKLDTAIAAGKVPDLVLIFGPDLAREGLVLPLDDMIAEEGIDLSTYGQAIVQPGDEFSCAYEDSLYCLGSYQGSVQLLYNKDLLDAAGLEYPAAWPPMTPDVFVDMACQLSNPEAGVWGAGVSDPLAYVPFDYFVSPDGRTAEGYVNSPEAVEQFELLAGAYEQGCIPTSSILDPWEQGRDYFARGELAMVITDFQDLDKVENAGINYGTTAPPTPEGVEPYFFVWTDSVGIMAESDNPEEAEEFIAYLTTEGQKLRYETSGDIPLDTAIAEEVDWAQGVPGREEGLEVLKHSRPLIFVPNRWEVFGPWYEAWDYVLAGEKTPQEALDDAAPAVQENLDHEWEVWERG